MFDKELMEYRVTEDQFNDLQEARHLITILEDLSEGSPTSKRVDLNRESLSSTYATIGKMMDKAIPELSPRNGGDS